MTRTLLTWDTIDRFVEIINPDTLTAEQITEVEHLAYVANIGKQGDKDAAWTHFCELLQRFAGITI